MKLNPTRSLRTTHGIKGKKQKVIATHSPRKIDQSHTLTLKFPDIVIQLPHKTESEIGPQLTTEKVTFQALSRFSVWRSRYSLDLRIQPFRGATFVVGKGYIGSTLLMINLILQFKAFRNNYNA